MGGSRSFLSGFAVAVIGAAGLLAAAVVLSAGHINPYSAAGWTAHVLRHRLALLDTKTSPAIIVVAGSNGLFGINASQIEAATGVRAINASNHAAMPWIYFDGIIFPHLQRGDILILPLEYGYLGERTGSVLNTIAVEAAHSLGLDFLHTLDASKVLEYLELLSPQFVFDQFTFTPTAEANVPSDGYDGLGPSHPNGDLSETEIPQNLDAVARLAPQQMFAPTALPPSGAACLTLRELTDRGITVIGTPPNVYVPPERMESFRALEPKLRAFYEGCGARFVADDTGGFQELSAMLDTPYHLSREGRHVRTARLIEALCEHVLTCKR